MSDIQCFEDIGGLLTTRFIPGDKRGSKKATATYSCSSIWLTNNLVLCFRKTAKQPLLLSKKGSASEGNNIVGFTRTFSSGPLPSILVQYSHVGVTIVPSGQLTFTPRLSRREEAPGHLAVLAVSHKHYKMLQMRNQEERRQLPISI
jgi:hypothetical protein